MRNHIGIYGIPDDGRKFSPKGNTHDHGMASITAERCTMVELERYTREKHDNHMPSHIMDILPSMTAPRDEVVITSVSSFLGSGFESDDGAFSIQPVSMEISDITRSTECTVNGHSVEGKVMCQEFAHIASCLPFIGSFEENSLLIHIDGGATDSASSAWIWESGKPTMIRASWDDLKDVVNNYNVNPLAQSILGLTMEDHLSMPGKLMGYASYGHCNAELEAWLKSNRWFLGTEDRNELLREINGFFGTNYTEFDNHKQEFMDVAYAIQHGFEEAVLGYIAEMKDRTGAEHLCYAGGAALNIDANSRIRNESGFKSIFIPPCTSDSGLCLGAAAWSYFCENGEVPKQSPYLGPNEPTILDQVEDLAKELSERKVIGLVTGRSETGPRALGHRSIIARADNVELRRTLSEYMKKREWYRPVAPVMLESVAETMLSDYAPGDRLAEYMLGTYHVREEYLDKFSGVVHANGTVRALVLKDNREPLFRILVELLEKYDIAALILTSFNTRGEPIVETVEDAMRSGKVLGLDRVVVL